MLRERQKLWAVGWNFYFPFFFFFDWDGLCGRNLTFCEFFLSVSSCSKGLWFKIRDIKCGKRESYFNWQPDTKRRTEYKEFSLFVFAAPAVFIFNHWFLVIIALKGVISEGNQLRTKIFGLLVFLSDGHGFLFCCLRRGILCSKRRLKYMGFIRCRR